MRKIVATISTFCLIAASAFPQTNQFYYWISLSDKEHNAYSLLAPEEFLSARSIHRRQKQEIQIDASDLPVSQFYIDSLEAIGLNIHNKSKWLNGVSVSTDNLELINGLHQLSFVDEVRLVAHFYSPPTKSVIDKFRHENFQEQHPLTETQLNMLGAESLHDAGFLGEGILIGVLDAGFDQINEIESMQHLFDEGRLEAAKDFVKDGRDMFRHHDHGTKVTSIIAGYQQELFHGAAPHCQLILVRTENGNSEMLLEEYDWIAGAEYCDSLGVDILNTSLGYSEFDMSEHNHSYEDLDGLTIPISIASGMAAAKGILLVTSAGNEGDDPWFHITAPADAKDILSIGALDSTQAIAGFSSRGNTPDRRIKPELCAMGLNVRSQYIPGLFTTCSGTSCSAPLVTGLAACLWQANPDASAMQIREAIIRSGDRYHTPDSIYGHGIPNFELAHNILNPDTLPRDSYTFKAYPNPSVSNFILEAYSLKSQAYTIQISNLNYMVMKTITGHFEEGWNMITLPTADLDRGYYITSVIIQGNFYNLSLLKL